MMRKTEKRIKVLFTVSYNKLSNEIFLPESDQIFAKKCNNKCLKFKNEGNDFYKEKELKSAQSSYSKALCFAEYNSDSYGIALANRSAVFFERKMFEECQLDIEECMKSSYREERRLKLRERLKKCEERIKNKEQKVVDQRGFLPHFIKNDIIFGASNAVEIEYSSMEGRHIIATKDLKAGQVLFVEPAFAFAQIFETADDFKAIKCFNCLKHITRLIPCKTCSICKYCSSTCRDESWNEVHRWECLGMKYGFWYNIGLGFPAFKALVKGIPSKFEPVAHIIETQRTFGNDYKYFDSLESHLEDMKDETLINICNISAQIVRYLELKTDFFEHLLKVGFTKNVVELIGFFLVKHMAQLSCNASVIEHWQYDIKDIEGFIDKGSPVASGIYPSVSLMNHSCKPNIAVYFIDKLIVVSAITAIAKGEQIFNSYGIDYRFSDKQERQEHLKELYYFDCNCTICSDDSKEFRHFDSISCPDCKQQVCLPIENLERVTICGNCNTNIANFASLKRDYFLVKSPETLAMTHEINLTNYGQLFRREVYRGEFETALAYLAMYSECFEARVGKYHIDYGIGLFRHFQCLMDIMDDSEYLMKSYNEHITVHSHMEKHLTNLRMIFRINYPYYFALLRNLAFKFEMFL